MANPPERPGPPVPIALPKDAVMRPDARLMRLPERVSAQLQTKSHAQQVHFSASVTSANEQLKALNLAIQYASRATSLIQDTQDQTSELLNLVRKIRSVARKMTLSDPQRGEQKRHQEVMEQLKDQAGKITQMPVTERIDSTLAGVPVQFSRPVSKKQAMLKLDDAANQLELQKTVLADTHEGIMQTLDSLTQTIGADKQGLSSEQLAIAVDHIEKTAEVMSQCAEVTKTAQKQAASEMFARIFKTL